VRIALVVAGGFDESGRDRVTPALLWLVERLARSHDVSVYVLQYHDRPHRYELLGATVHDLGRPRGLWRQYAALVGALRQAPTFDVLHGYMALPAGFVAASAGRRLGIRSVVTFDSGEFAALPDIDYGLQRRSRQRLAVTAAARLAGCVTVSSLYQQRLARAHGVAAEWVPTGVDTGLFMPARRADGPPWRLVHVASLNQVKDQRTLLRAFKLLIERPLDVLLDIAGEDTLNGEIQRLAESLGVSGRVAFHGRLASPRLLPLYQRAHLHVVSSRHEAAHVATLEASACGVPTVGSAVGYIADFAPDRAVAVTPADPRLLADAVVELLHDAPRRNALAQAARAWTLAHDADFTARRFQAIYAAR
jgi:glycosyltransferase involved in cell wall biosynthesis